MGLAEDYASTLEMLEETVPVRCGAVSTRAHFARAGAVRTIAGLQVQLEHDTLFIRRGALDPELRVDARITVGARGALTADGGTQYVVVDPSLAPYEDYRQRIAIAGGAES